MEIAYKSISILLSVLFVFLLENSAFSNYSSYLLAILIIFTIIYTALKKRSPTANALFSGTPLELFASSSIVLLILNLTGNLFSPLFFFLYLFLILLVFLAGPISTLVFSLSICLYFLPETLNFPTTESVAKIISFLLLAPIAYFIGNEFERRKRLNEKIEAKTDEIIQEAENMKQTSDHPDEEDALNDIIEEAESLKKDSENLP